MYRYLSFFPTLLLFTLPLFGQIPITWIQLAKISYEMDKGEDGSFGFPTPAFSQNILDLNEKEVLIKGYMIPLDVEGTSYAISAFPNSSCFFCGAAGQESVMRMEIKDERLRYGIDEFRTFKGTLKLNYLPNDLLYILVDAVEVK